MTFNMVFYALIALIVFHLLYFLKGALDVAFEAWCPEKEYLSIYIFSLISLVIIYLIVMDLR